MPKRSLRIEHVSDLRFRLINDTETGFKNVALSLRDGNESTDIATGLDLRAQTAAMFDLPPTLPHLPSEVWVEPAGQKGKEISLPPGFERCPKEGAAKNPNIQGFEVDRGLYVHPRPGAKALIRRWVKEARRSYRDRQHFEAFIYAWIGFNAWASCCCSGIERDSWMLHMLMLDEGLNADFEHLMTVGSLGKAARHFANQWPIFKASALSDESHHAVSDTTQRTDVVQIYARQRPPVERAPGCLDRHEDQVPADWPHTLAALYRVRNNLFHGQKANFRPRDAAIVKDAVAVLLPITWSVTIPEEALILD